MVVGCCAKIRDGLVTEHAYSLLDTVEIYGERLAKLRNPNNFEHYTGPWSDDDSRWTDSLKQQLGHTSADDGIFFMPLDNFVDYFTDTAVSLYEKYAKE